MEDQQIQAEIAKLSAIDVSAMSDSQRARHTETLAHWQQQLMFATK